MNEQDLILIKSRTLVIKEKEPSGEIVLTDPHEGDMYFSFRLLYLPQEGHQGNIRMQIIDNFHARFEIDTYPNAVTETASPVQIGSYENKYPLYIKIVVEAQTPQTEAHNVIVTFLRGKEVIDGAEK